MSHEITNTKRGSSVVRCVDPGVYTIELTDLRGNPTNEVVSAAVIKKMAWSTNGSIQISRCLASVNTALISLHGQGTIELSDLGHAVANTNTGNVAITIATGGTIFLELSKVSTFNVDPNTGQTV